MIATSELLQELERRWRADGIDLDAAHERGQYVPVKAAETLTELMLDGWPQERRFRRHRAIAIATRRHHGRVRARLEELDATC